MTLRKIVHIDQSKCDGCGQCVPSCAEGAIQIIDGKALLVSDVYCDGLGACLGHCPQGAIRVVEREAPDFDEQAVARHLAAGKAQPQLPPVSMGPAGCPGAAVRQVRTVSIFAPAKMGLSPLPEREASGGEHRPPLANWPIQLHLVPPGAPFLRDADLLLVADCVPFAYAEFHAQLVRGRPVIIGCPKLDDASAYVQKLTAILGQASLRSLTVVHMEVPCCTGLVRIAQAALKQSGSRIPLGDVTISIGGRRLTPAAPALG